MRGCILVYRTTGTVSEVLFTTYDHQEVTGVSKVLYGEVDSVCMEGWTVYAWRGGQCMYGEVDSVCMERWTVYVWRGGQCMHEEVDSVCMERLTVYAWRG